MYKWTFIGGVVTLFPNFVRDDRTVQRVVERIVEVLSK